MGAVAPLPEALIARLRESAARCYPEAARKFRLRGSSVIAFCLRAGAATQTRLLTSSGQPLLDRAAQDCVLPGALPVAGVEGCFQVPVRFGGP